MICTKGRFQVEGEVIVLHDIEGIAVLSGTNQDGLTWTQAAARLRARIAPSDPRITEGIGALCQANESAPSAADVGSVSHGASAGSARSWAGSGGVPGLRGPCRTSAGGRSSVERRVDCTILWSLRIRCVAPWGSGRSVTLGRRRSRRAPSFGAPASSNVPQYVGDSTP